MSHVQTDSESTGSGVRSESDVTLEIPSGQSEPSSNVHTESPSLTDSDDLSDLMDSQFADAVRHSRPSRNVTNRTNHRGNSNSRLQPHRTLPKMNGGLSAVTGSAVDIRGLRAVTRNQYMRPNVPSVFVSRLHPRTSEEDIARHIREKTGLRLKVQRLQTKYRYYSSFHLAVEKSLMSRLFVSRLWPQDTLVKEYEY